MFNDNVLNNLQKRNNSLKSKLIHEQLKSNNYSFEYFKKYSSLILNEFKKHNYLYKAALTVGVDYNTVLEWYIQGQLNNPQFRGFYLAVNSIKNDDYIQNTEEKTAGENFSQKINEEFQGEYIISEYGDGWSYKTFIEGEKIFIISDDLENLKRKVKAKNLPLD